MDQLIHASLSPTHYWYEVGMSKVPAGTIYSSNYRMSSTIVYVVYVTYNMRDDSLYIGSMEVISRR